MSVKKIGDWVKAKEMAANLAMEMQKARRQALMQFGLKAEAIAKTHISAQDLPWASLKPSTIERKVRKGYSENILVETSTYFQSITSWVENDVALVGVRRRVVTQDGQEVADIAKIHEYGTTRTPARPLWSPSLKEAINWFWTSDSTPVKIFMKNTAKYRR